MRYFKLLVNRLEVAICLEGMLVVDIGRWGQVGIYRLLMAALFVDERQIGRRTVFHVY